MVAQVGYSVAGRLRGRVAPCAVCTWHVETRSASFLVEPQNQGGGQFSGLCLKTGSSGLVIWASKSPRRFLSLGIKTKWTSVCRLRHKTDGGRSARDTRRDLAACLASKQTSFPMKKKFLFSTFLRESELFPRKFLCGSCVIHACFSFRLPQSGSSQEAKTNS
jgi:hypothetical protein